MHHALSLSLTHTHTPSSDTYFTFFLLSHFSVCTRENEASLAVLPDLLMELDSMSEVCVFMTAVLCLSLLKGMS
jgi:hypothetical protein